MWLKECDPSMVKEASSFLWLVPTTYFWEGLQQCSETLAVMIFIGQSYQVLQANPIRACLQQNTTFQWQWRPNGNHKKLSSNSVLLEHWLKTRAFLRAPEDHQTPVRKETRRWNRELQKRMRQQWSGKWADWVQIATSCQWQPLNPIFLPKLDHKVWVHADLLH